MNHLKTFPKFFKTLTPAKKTVFILVALVIFSYVTFGAIMTHGLVILLLVALALFARGAFTVSQILEDYFKEHSKN